jgi:hypothetical protein
VLLPQTRQRSTLDYRVAAAYLGGTTAGALLTASIAWVFSGFAAPLPPVVRLFLLAGGALFIWMVKQGPLAGVLALPESRRQIPAEVFGGSLVSGAFRFGFELGTGFRTYVSSAAPYILLLAIVAANPPLGLALATGLGFGVGRAMPLMITVSANERLQFTREFLTGLDRFAPTLAGLLVLIGALSLV